MAPPYLPISSRVLCPDDELRGHSTPERGAASLNKSGSPIGPYEISVVSEPAYPRGNDGTDGLEDGHWADDPTWHQDEPDVLNQRLRPEDVARKECSE